MSQSSQKRSRVQGGAWSGGIPPDNPTKPSHNNNNNNNNDSDVQRKRVSYNNNVKQQKPKYKILQNGLVLLPKAIQWNTQNWLIDICFALGKASSTDFEGFYEEKDGRMVLNQGTRGRVIKPMGVFPPEFKELCLKMVEYARTVDNTIPPMDPNTVLINYYNEKATFKWHKDSEDSNLVKTKQGKPIVSFSIGQSATFAYKRRYEDQEYSTVRLNSGDVLIFGGPSRMIVHSVTEIIGKTLPAPVISKMLSGRLNLTVRDIGNGKIDNSQFPAYRVVYPDAQGQDENPEDAI